MTAWTDALPGRDATRFGRHVSARDHELVGYAGPADGDFARYVDQLLANAETQRRAQIRAPAPVHDARGASRPAALPAGGHCGNARRNQAQAAKRSAADSLASLRSQALDAASKPVLKVGMRLILLLLWLPVMVGMLFWQGAAIWSIGLLVIGGLLFNAVRKQQGGKKR